MIRQRSRTGCTRSRSCAATSAFGEAARLGARATPLPATSSTRSLRPPVPLPRHRLARPQLRRARRTAPVRVPAPRGLPPLDRQPAIDRVGARRRRRGRPPRARPGPLPLRDRPLQGLPVDRGARPRRRLRAPAEGSRWAKDTRDLPEVEDPKQLVDLVKDDEFPLSLFYTSLKPKLEPVLSRPPDGRGRPPKRISLTAVNANPRGFASDNFARRHPDASPPSPTPTPATSPRTATTPTRRRPERLLREPSASRRVPTSSSTGAPRTSSR